ncbi:hypothetical protein DV738_g1442, partial [Chaetothyriales sp. CBS 135597]
MAGMDTGASKGMDMGVTLGQPSAPRSIDQITAQAQDYDFDANVPLRYWLRSANVLLQQARRYLAERDDETAYFLLFRHAHLVLTNLTSHPEAKKAEYRPALAEHNREVKASLNKLDVLKPRIKERHDRYVQLVAAREQNRRWAEQERRTGYDRDEQQHHEQSRYSAHSIRQLPASENKDLAMRTAQKELSRRQATKQPPGDDLQARLQAIRSRVEPAVPDRAEQDAYGKTPTYNYPSVPSKHASGQEREAPVPQPFTYQQEYQQEQHNHYSAASPPALPPKHYAPSARESARPPVRPEKVPNKAAVEWTSTPVEEKSFAPAAYLENGEPLRTVFLPATLRTTFLRLAHKNTRANVETCAFLAGFLSRNAFFVSRLVVPAQTATSDTCEMTNEAQLFDYVDSEDLMILGWIHTHPTQTCFMSSRDLHTHAGYQVMLAESVAIVCAPSKGDTLHGGDWGVFRLTDPPGKKTILDCRNTGVFHPHTVDDIYTSALRPGHVIELTELKFEVVDLRVETEESNHEPYYVQLSSPSFHPTEATIVPDRLRFFVSSRSAGSLLVFSPLCYHSPCVWVPAHQPTITPSTAAELQETTRTDRWIPATGASVAASALSLLVSLATAQTTTSSSSTAAGVAGPIQTLDCYNAIPSDYDSKGSYTFQTSGYCQDQCAGYSVMAITAGSTCYCANELPSDENKASSTNCNTPCQGFGTETCGGLHYYQLYLTGDGAPEANADPSATTSTIAIPSVVTASGTIVTVTASVAAPSTTAAESSAASDKSNGGGTRRRRLAIEEEHRRNAAAAAAASGFAAGKSETSSATDQRLDPASSLHRRNSLGSIADEQDFSRRILQVRNPDRDSRASNLA